MADLLGFPGDMLLGLFANTGEMCSSDSVLLLAAKEQESSTTHVAVRE